MCCGSGDVHGTSGADCLHGLSSLLGRYGELGEYLLVTPKENERVDKAIGMVPVRITIALTLRELRPMAGSGLLNVSAARRGREGAGWGAKQGDAPSPADEPVLPMRQQQRKREARAAPRLGAPLTAAMRTSPSLAVCACRTRTGRSTLCTRRPWWTR